jgi:hypothetical protein
MKKPSNDIPWIAIALVVLAIICIHQLVGRWGGFGLQ